MLAIVPHEYRQLQQMLAFALAHLMPVGACLHRMLIM